VEVSITAEPTRLSMIPGVTTSAFAYNGRVPGPTLEVREGDHVIIHLHNKLPYPTTIHWHGMHIPVQADGSPFYAVQPGKSYDYVFTVLKGTAGTYWYHPHPDHDTGFQIAKGLFGALIVRAADDPIPKSVADKVLILSDNRFRRDGSIDLPDADSPGGRFDRENGREGDVLFVNGQVMPKITIRPGEVQRWRVINASAARVYKLAIPGHTMLHIGNDGGLFEHPVEVKDIVIANSERVELLVRGTGKPGEHTVLQTLPYDRYMAQTKPDGWDKPKDLLSLEYTNESPAAPVAIPATLRKIPVLDTAQATATRVMVLSQGFINGKLHDMNRVDVDAKLGATEIWQIENIVGMDHPFHLHGFQFQVIDRDGVPVPFRSWKDTVNVPKHSTVRFIVRYDDYPGKWMFHCHILDHEDHGMMGVLEVH
jgi:FtsP/CotA-like multicopper oxidase with cupredoxin domain